MHPENTTERPDEILELWENFLAAKLDDQGAEKLTAWFHAHPSELSSFRSEAAVSLSLAYLLQPEPGSRRFAQSIQSRLVGKLAGRDSGRLKSGVMAQLQNRRGTHKFRRHFRRTEPISWTNAAVIVLALSGLAFFVLSQNKPLHPPKATVVAAPAPASQAPTPTPVAKTTLRLEKGAASVDSRPLASAQSVELKAGSHIDLESDARGLLTLADGSTFKLIDQTKLNLTDVEHGARLKLERGRVEVHANHQEHGDKLVIETPHTAVTVVGTDFAVDALADRSHVAVQSGTVSVANVGKNAATQALTLGEELWADDSGLGSVRSGSHRRVLSMADAAVDEFPDPLVTSEATNPLFGDLPVRNFSYTHPRAGAKFYAGLYWPVKLAPEEVQFEVWVRPKSIKLNPKFDTMYVFILLQEGDTEYMAGQLDLKPGDNGWHVLTGSIKNAEVNWVRPHTRQLPARADLIERLALRVCNGDIEMDYTPIVIWK